MFAAPIYVHAFETYKAYDKNDVLQTTLALYILKKSDDLRIQQFKSLHPEAISWSDFKVLAACDKEDTLENAKREIEADKAFAKDLLNSKIL